VDADPGPEPAERPDRAIVPDEGTAGDPDGCADAVVADPPDGTLSDDTGSDEGKDPLRFNRWMKRSATGAVMTGIAVGLQQALELPRQQPAFVIEAAGEPEDPDRPIDLQFDPDSPANTVAIIRRPPPDHPAGEPDRSGSPEEP
jgi:hypothetical protein